MKIRAGRSRSGGWGTHSSLPANRRKNQNVCPTYWNSLQSLLAHMEHDRTLEASWALEILISVVLVKTPNLAMAVWNLMILFYSTCIYIFYLSKIVLRNLTIKVKCSKISKGWNCLLEIKKMKLKYCSAYI